MAEVRVPIRTGFVIPDAKTAIRVAEAILDARFGSETVLRFRPYRAELEGNNWLVVGTPQDGSIHGGGMPEMSISKIDGKVDRMNLSR